MGCKNKNMAVHVLRASVCLRQSHSSFIVLKQMRAHEIHGDGYGFTFLNG